MKNKVLITCENSLIVSHEFAKLGWFVTCIDILPHTILNGYEYLTKENTTFITYPNTGYLKNTIKFHS